MTEPDPRTLIANFAAKIIGKPLYPYQLDIAEAILISVEQQQGKIITVMSARQMGKNQLSAIIEAYLLHRYTEGTIVKAAPTFKPQIINSRLRLMSMLRHAWLKDRYYGYLVHPFSNLPTLPSLAPFTDVFCIRCAGYVGCPPSNLIVSLINCSFVDDWLANWAPCF
jgi:hypothetical protein